MIDERLPLDGWCFQGAVMKRDENLNVEYEESWHDKYLEWICGYANAKGGIL